MRPRTIELACGLALQRGQDNCWRCANGTSFEGPLRDLVGRLAHQALVVQHYQHAPGLETTYEIIQEIRARWGGNFIWDVYQPDDSAVVLSDELDDICCESRAWFTGGATLPRMILTHEGQARPSGAQSVCHAHRALQWVAHRWNASLGHSGSAAPLLTPPVPWSLHHSGQLWTFTGADGTNFMSTRTHHPRGTAPCAETRRLCELIRDIANAS